jgi:hypothetical protein
MSPKASHATEEIKSLSLAGIEPRFLGRPACGLVVIPAPNHESCKINMHFTVAHFEISNQKPKIKEVELLQSAIHNI